jgi:hypothetical protein
MTPVFSGRTKLAISLAKYGFAPRCAGVDVHSLPRGKERTKKARQRLPPLETASVPLFKADRGEKHIYLHASLAA